MIVLVRANINDHLRHENDNDEQRKIRTIVKRKACSENVYGKSLKIIRDKYRASILLARGEFGIFFFWEEGCDIE